MDNKGFPTVGSQGKNLSISDMFNRPGGTFAKITAIGAALGLGFGFFKALPFLISAAENLLVFIAELVGIAAILFVLTSSDIRKWVSLFWLQVNRKIVGAFVKIDPISILERSIENMKIKLAGVHENNTTLRSILIKMKNKLEEYESDMAENLSKLKIQKRKLSEEELQPNDKLRVQLSINNLNQDVANLDKMITSQKKRIEVSEKYQKVIEKLEIIAGERIKGSELELSRSKDAYEQAKAQQSALKSISAIMNGDTKSLEEELAIEHITNTVNMSIAEMERFINDSNGILEDYNLGQEVNDVKVQAILDKYDKFTSFSTEDIQDVDYVEVPNTPAKRGGGHQWC